MTKTRRRLTRYTLCASLLFIPLKSFSQIPVVETSISSETSESPPSTESVPVVEELDVSTIAQEFNIRESFAKKVVDIVTKYSYKDFPTSSDVLAVIAVESRFNPNARSKGSRGIMQINSVNRTGYDLDANIKMGIQILRDSYVMFRKNPRAAIMAYNLGEGAYLKGRRNAKYYSLVSKRARWFESANSTTPPEDGISKLIEASTSLTY